MSLKNNMTQPITKWGEKPYHSLDYMLRERFGEKVYKVTLNGGMSCPNRDGRIGTRGCIFCSAGGSGDLKARLPFSHRKDRYTNISPIFRHIQTLTLRSTIWRKFSQKQSLILKWSHFPSAPDPTASARKSSNFCPA